MEHRLVGTGRGGLTQYSSSEREPVGWSRAVLGTLLGPEGPGAWRSTLSGAGLRSNRSRPVVFGWRVVGRRRVGLVFARTLRTAQWTRASLWPS